MSKAEERALEAYPIAMSQYSDNCKEYDSNESDRLTFIEGYHKAEKDLELTWEDILRIDEIISEVYKDSDSCNTKNIYQEVLKRFKERKENNALYRL